MVAYLRILSCPGHFPNSPHVDVDVGDAPKDLVLVGALLAVDVPSCEVVWLFF